MLDPCKMTGESLGERIWQIAARFRKRCTADDTNVVREAAECLRDHDTLVQDVLPDLRNRITALESQLKTNASAKQNPESGEREKTSADIIPVQRPAGPSGRSTGPDAQEHPPHARHAG